MYDFSYAKSVVTEMHPKGNFSLLAEMHQAAIESVSASIAECVQEDAIEVLRDVLTGLGVDVATALNDPNAAQLIGFLQCYLEVAIVHNGRYVNGETFDRTVPDGTANTEMVEMPSLRDLTALPV